MAYAVTTVPARPRDAGVFEAAAVAGADGDCEHGRSLLAGFTQLAHNLAGSRQVSTAFTFIYVGKTICK